MTVRLNPNNRIHDECKPKNNTMRSINKALLDKCENISIYILDIHKNKNDATIFNGYFLNTGKSIITL